MSVEPLFQAGAFHIEFIEQAWGVYDSYDNRVHLYFATDAEAIEACTALATAAEVSHAELDAEYGLQLCRARMSMELA
jgi:hypothetical protein